jgi:orotidine-5'-phosphate decarboxylase
VLRGRDRLIVALDVPTVANALEIVDTLDDVSFFKVGWQLFMAGVTSGNLSTLLTRLQTRDRNVFIDLKVPGDIGNTIGSMVRDLCGTNVKFLTINEHMPVETIRAARAARGASAEPKLLMVPYLSSLDGSKDLQEVYGEKDFESFLVKRAKTALDAGCDGLIASGNAIALFRATFPNIPIVSPGIRPVGASHDDHKRFTTPAQAIKLGADYLVVGRPILKAPDPREAARQVIAEIDEALEDAARDHAAPPVAHPR